MIKKDLQKDYLLKSVLTAFMFLAGALSFPSISAAATPSHTTACGKHAKKEAVRGAEQFIKSLGLDATKFGYEPMSSHLISSACDGIAKGLGPMETFSVDVYTTKKNPDYNSGAFKDELIRVDVTFQVGRNNHCIHKETLIH